MSKKITLACEKCKNKNYRLYKTQQERLVLKKFCNTCRVHQSHKEEK